MRPMCIIMHPWAQLSRGVGKIFLDRDSLSIAFWGPRGQQWGPDVPLDPPSQAIFGIP